MKQKSCVVAVRSALLAVVGAAMSATFPQAYAQPAMQSQGPLTDTASAPGQEEATPQSQSQHRAPPHHTQKKEQKPQLPQKPATLEAIKVVGTLGALMRAQVTKENAIGVVDSISAEEAGKFPDQTVAGALQRVPGVSVNRGGDETNQITVRGFGPQFQTTLLDGRRIASASGTRAFNFDVLPVELLQQAVVHKTSSADTVSGGIGATIDIHTWQPLEFSGFHTAGTVLASYSNVPGETAHRKVTPKVSGIVGDTNRDHTFGWLIAADYYKSDQSDNALTDSGWFQPAYPLLGASQQGIFTPQTSQVTINQNTQYTRAFNGSVEWRPIEHLTLSANYLYTEFNEQTYQNAFGLFSNPQAVTSMTADANRTALTFMQNASGAMSDDEIMDYTPSDQRVTLGGFRANYDFGDGSAVDFDTSVSNAWNKQAGASYFTVLGTRNFGVTPIWTNNGPDTIPTYSDFLPPVDQVGNLFAHFDERGQGGGAQNISDSVRENQLGFTHEFDSGPLSSIKLGVTNTAHTERQVGFVEPGSFSCVAYCGYVAHVPASDVGAHVQHFGTVVGGAAPGMPTSWIVYDPNALFDYLATPAAYDQLPPETAATLVQNLEANGGFTARPNPSTFSRVHELDRAAYVMLNFAGSLASMPWQLQTGMRYSNTRTSSEAFSIPLLSIHVNPLDPTNAQPVFGELSNISANGKYHYWLPSLDFRINVLPKVVARFAASRTMSRPTLSNLSAATSYDFRPTNQTVSKGNANLKPYLSTNYDAGAEWYFGSASYVAVDYFFKKVKNFDTIITTNTEILGFPFQLTQPVNLNRAIVKGIEATWNQHFTFLPSPFNGFGMALNYTYVTSSASISGQELAAGSKFGIPGIGNSYNASLYYQRGPIEARFAYNWRSQYMSTIAGAQGQPTTVRPYGELDFSGSYQLNRNLQVFVAAQNLTNEMIYDFQVYENRPADAEADGRTVMVGLHGSWH